MLLLFPSEGVFPFCLVCDTWNLEWKAFWRISLFYTVKNIILLVNYPYAIETLLFFHYIFEFSDFTFFRAARYSNISHCLIICVDPQLKRDFPFLFLVRFTMENNSNGTIRWYPYTFSRKQTTRLEVGSFELYFFGKMPKNVLMYGWRNAKSLTKYLFEFLFFEQELYSSGLFSSERKQYSRFKVSRTILLWR